MHSTKPYQSLKVSIVATSLVLSACGQGVGELPDGNNALPELGAALTDARSTQFDELRGVSISKVGQVAFTTLNLAFAGYEITETSAFAQFNRLDTPVQSDEIFDVIANAQASTMGCTSLADSQFDASAMSADLSEFLDGDQLDQLSSVNAGNALTISSPAGTWSELLVETHDAPFTDGEIYQIANGGFVSGELPNNSTIDIPGGEFETFSAVSIPELAPLGAVSLESAETDRVLPDATFTWNVDTESDDLVIIMLMPEADNNNFTASEDPAIDDSIVCLTNDSGSFAIPDNVDQQLLAKTYSNKNMIMMKAAVSYEVQGDALLVLARINALANLQLDLVSSAFNDVLSTDSYF